jgi:hypothetical protein
MKPFLKMLSFIFSVVLITTGLPLASSATVQEDEPTYEESYERDVPPVEALTEDIEISEKLFYLFDEKLVKKVLLLDQETPIVLQYCMAHYCGQKILMQELLP